MCHLYTLAKMSNFYGSFFYIIICGFISRDKFLYETRLLDNSQFKVQLPTSDMTEITAGGTKVTLEGPVPLDAPSGKNTFVLNASTLKYIIVFLVSIF